MSNSVIQTPYTKVNKKILNIRKSQSLGKWFCEFLIQLCASSLDVLQENNLFQNAENSPQNTENYLSVR